MLEILLSFSLDTRPMDLGQFEKILDQFVQDLPEVLDQVHFNPPDGSPVDAASTLMAERLGQRLMPLADAIVAEATGRPAEGISAVVRAATALAAVAQLFPASSVQASLQAAATHATGWIVLRSKASTAGMPKH